MAAPFHNFHLPVTAAQVGTYFVGQYYQVLQHQPEFIHQFYSDASTMIRVDGNGSETATTLLQIHTLAMSLNCMGIEVETVHSLKSWNGGVLVMVSGSVDIKNFSSRRKFVQTFFLAPQEKGYFILNDMFHFVEEEPIRHHPVAYSVQSNLGSKLNASTTIREQVSNYMLGGETVEREFVDPADITENGLGYGYSLSEQRLQYSSEAECILEDNFPESNSYFQNSINPVLDHLSAPVEEHIEEPRKHTYASILQVAKEQPAISASPQPSVNKFVSPVSEWNHTPKPPTQQSVASSTAVESSWVETPEEFSAVEDEDEIKSVYVRNLPLIVSASEIEEEFKKFGKLKPDPVAIRNRKEIGVCYAFVEFEDITGVQNAIKASTLQIAGQQVFIEERRANRANAFRGGRRGRGRGGYTMEASRGRFGHRSFGRGNDHDGGDHRDFNRPRGNGLYRPAMRQVSVSGQN